jgi:ketosteroid isomerase-like protein
MTPDQIADAFSSHRFPDAAPHLAPDVRWRNVGGDDLAGRDAVLGRCEELARYLETVTTSFSEFRTLPGGEHVVVESVASYAEAGGDVSMVASCDVYRFAGGRVAAITSYNVELSAR